MKKVFSILICISLFFVLSVNVLAASDDDAIDYNFENDQVELGESPVLEELMEEDGLLEEQIAMYGLNINVDCGVTTTKAWLSDSGIYYLFIPNNVNLPDVEFVPEGINVATVSSGTFDRDTGLVSGAFSKSGDVLIITTTENAKYVVEVMQSDIPSIMIDLAEGVTVDALNGGSKDTKYAGNTVNIIDMNGDVLNDTNIEIKGRGNSTWQGTKKPYQIKFNNKTSVLGMDKAKKWVLLANAFDDSMMRNEVAFRASKNLNMTFSPDFEYVNLWLNGEYYGLYAIGEKVEIGKGRLDLGSDTAAALFEYDLLYYTEEDYYFNTSIGYFTVKESNSSDDAEIRASADAFKTKFEGFLSYIYDNNSEDITLEGLAEYIDLESFAQYLLVTDFFRNADSGLTSDYFYIRSLDDKIHMGPIWDYDSSMGNDNKKAVATSKGNNVCDTYMCALMESPVFSNYMKDYYEAHRDAFSSSAAFADSLYEKLENSANMNYSRWEYALGHGSNPRYLLKVNSPQFKNTYYDAYMGVRKWLSNRNTNFKAGCPEYYAVQKGGYFVIRYDGQNLAAPVKFAVNCRALGLNPTVWANGKPNDDGSYSAVISLESFAQLGRMDVKVYSNGALKDSWVKFAYEKNRNNTEDSAYLFYDVGSANWFHNPVTYVNSKGIMTGVKESYFSPNTMLSREQFAVIMYRLAGRPEAEYQSVFSDVPDGKWYTSAVMWASQNKIITGYSGSKKFGIGDNITREQMAVILIRYANYLGADTSATTDLSKFTDVGRVASYAAPALKWCVAEELITGKSGGKVLDPKGNATRAETAAIMTRFCKKYVDVDPAEPPVEEDNTDSSEGSELN